MKKTLRSIFTLCLSLVFVITLCPCFSVMAATDLSTLTAEALAVSTTAGNQSPNNIVADLTLPPEEGITWSSSNPGVISNDGKVTRPLMEDVAVTLTGTQGETTKTFNYVVKAKKTNVVAQESFCYDGLENTDSTTNILASDAMKANGWTSDTETFGSKIVTDANANKYITFDIGPGGKIVQWNKTVEKDSSGKINLSFDYLHPKSGASGNSYMNAVLEDANGNKKEVTLVLVTNGNWVGWGNYNKTGQFSYITDSFLPVTLEMDLNNLKIKSSYNGKQFDVDMYDPNGGTVSGTYEKLVSLQIWSAGKYIDSFDNIVFSTDAELTAAEALSLVSADSLAGTQAPTAITSNLAMPEHSGISWASSNPDVISNTGVVTRPLAADSNVTMTATTTDGESVSFDFTVKAKTKKVLASENFAAYAELTNDNHDTNIFTSMTNWNRSTSTGSHITEDYLEVGFDKNPETAHNVRWDISSYERVVYFDIDFKRDEKGMPFNLQAYFWANANGTEDWKIARFATIYDGYVYWGNNASGKYTPYTLGYWHTLSFKIDMNELKTYGSLDGGEWTEIDMLAYYGGNFNVKDSSTYTRENTSINYMQRIHFALNSGASSNVMLDNLVLSTDAFSVTSTVRDDETGIVSATLGNAGTEAIEATAICAGYTGGKLTQIELKPVTLNAGSNNVTFAKSFTGATNYSIYLWSDKDKLIPLCSGLDK